VVLLILDDVWDVEHASAFDALGPRARMLVTSRNDSVVTALNAVSLRLEPLSAGGALSTLAAYAEMKEEELPSEAREVAEACGHLPLALSMCGALAKTGVSWASLLERLRAAELQPEGSQSYLSLAIQASLQSLSSNDVSRFLELATCVIDMPLSRASVRALWSRTAGLTEDASDRLLAELVRRSLVDEQSVQGEARLTVHDLLRNYSERLLGPDKQ
jgi:hypothetical protein